MQPGQSRRREGTEHGVAKPCCWCHEPQSQRDRERRGHLGVNMKGVRRQRRTGGNGRGQGRRARIARSPQGQRPDLDDQPGGQKSQDDDAGPAAAHRVHGGEEQGQARAVRGKGPPVSPGRAVVRLHGPQGVLPPVFPRIVVAQVEIALAPQAAGHDEVVRLVSRDPEATRVPQTHEQEESRRGQKHGPRAGVPKRRRVAPARPEKRRSHGDPDQNQGEGPPEEKQTRRHPHHRPGARKEEQGEGPEQRRKAGGEGHGGGPDERGRGMLSN